MGGDKFLIEAVKSSLARNPMGSTEVSVEIRVTSQDPLFPKIKHIIWKKSFDSLDDAKDFAENVLKKQLKEVNIG
ncbi:MAG: hypothetical protein ACUVTD_07935 [Nitrososphaerales archaeon]